MPASEGVAGRAYARIYSVLRRADLRDFLADSVARSGGTLLYASNPHRAPVYLGVGLDPLLYDPLPVAH